MMRAMRSWQAIVGLIALGAVAEASAFSITISPGSHAVYLQVGIGTFTGSYSTGGTGGANATINKVTVSVPAAAVGSGAAQAMTSDSTQAVSFYDNRTFCSPPSQVYIGGYVRSGQGNPAATLTVSTSAPNLVNAAGDTIPFSEISWTSSGIGDVGAEAIPGGTFTGGTQSLATFPTNTWAESCHTFTYANTSRVASGTYTGRATYTLSLP
jgi:hypothetical protein